MTGSRVDDVYDGGDIKKLSPHPEYFNNSNSSVNKIWMAEVGPTKK